MIHTTPIVAPNLSATDTTARVPVGTIVSTTDGGEAIYVIALSAIAQYDVVAILNSSSAAGASICAAPITTTNAATSPRVGFAQVAIAAASFGWVHTKGNNLRANVLVSCQPAVPLYTTATAGSLDDTIVSAGYVAGCVAMSSAASASAVPVVVGGACIAQIIG